MTSPCRRVHADGHRQIRYKEGVTSGKLRFVLALLIVFLIAASCGFSRRGATPVEDEGNVSYGDPGLLDIQEKGLDPETGEPLEEGASGGSGGSSGGSGGSGSSSGGSGSGSGSGFDPLAANRRVHDFGPLGNAVCGMTMAEPYKRIVIEIDFVEGREPTAYTRSALKSKIAAITGKPVSFDGGNEIPYKPVFTTEDVIKLARARDITSTAPVAAFWIGFLTQSEFTTALGVAYAGTVATVFRDAMGSVTLPPGYKQEEIEAATTLHEAAGHNMALVNIGYESPRDHESQSSEHHSKNPKSVMYPAFASTERLSEYLATGGAIPQDFDADDKADLADIKSGKIQSTLCR